MCLFTGPVKNVANTRIFARMEGDRQFLVYEMEVTTIDAVAMILPLPISLESTDPLNFLSLEDYPRFFPDLHRCFPKREVFSGTRGPAAPPARAPLRVQQVGVYEASYVPSREDFSRLDARFRLPDEVLGLFPDYSDFGFAVFQLRRGVLHVHPMALSFSARDPSTLFYPTSHLHDGLVHQRASFDHLLYAQCAPLNSPWETSASMPREVMNLGNWRTDDPTHGIVEGYAPVYRRFIRGEFPNTDQRIPARGVGQ